MRPRGMGRMKNQRVSSVLATSVFAIALAVASSGCGPIAASENKDNLPTPVNGGGGGGGTGGGSASFTFAGTQVVAADQYAGAITVPSQNQIQFSATQNTTQFNQFINNGSVTFAITGQTPALAKAVVQITGSDTDASGYNGPFQLSLVQSSGGWLLSIQPSVSSSISTAVLASIANVTIEFNQAETLAQGQVTVTFGSSQSGQSGNQGSDSTTGSN